MCRSLRYGFSLLICFLAIESSRAQHSFSFDNSAELQRYQDSLVKISHQAAESESGTDRMALNAEFIRTFVNALKTPYSFNFGFDSLNRISILKSADKTFRIFSWSVPLDDGTYRFYGSIQMATPDGKLQLFPLIDDTGNFGNENEISDNKHWFGAKYYEIIPVIISGRQPYYTLIGWKGNNQKTSKKVIDILSFSQGTPTFGKPVFEGNKGNPPKNRIVFEYNRLNSMTLTMDKTVNMIVFDHLAPFSPELAGNPEFYASDLSFDAYKNVNGKWKLQENVQLKNEPNEMDDFYTDPTSKEIKPVKKL